MDGIGDNNNNCTPVSGQFSDAQKSMFDDTTEGFWKEAIRVCDEVERQNYAKNATTTRIQKTPIQATQTNQEKPSQTKNQKHKEKL